MTEQKAQPKVNINLSIMQREYTVACQENESAGLIEAAAHLDKHMRLISENSRVLGMDRCAVMAGLNISYSFLKLQKLADQNENVGVRMEKLHDQVDKVITNIQQDMGHA